MNRIVEYSSQSDDSIAYAINTIYNEIAGRSYKNINDEFSDILIHLETSVNGSENKTVARNMSKHQNNHDFNAVIIKSFTSTDDSLLNMKLVDDMENQVKCEVLLYIPPKKWNKVKFI